ncbi:agmatinase [archaeon BMS3Abin16]|nr:agmatinase [archaeon BMS3Abin16]HDY73537.1 agmatinase [Euryarchaeota archaeon]
MYRVPQTFARREETLAEAKFAVLGIPFDSSESYRTGSRLGPNAIREASRDIEDYDLEDGSDLLNLSICDLGDLEVSFGNYSETEKRAVETITEIIGAGAVPVCLGGEHTITYFAAKALKKDIFYVVFDAHLDYRDGYIENRFSHASVTRRLAELVGAENILVVGVRSASSEELAEAKKDGLHYISAIDFYRDRAGAQKKIESLTAGRSVYLSIDLDAVDPSEARGVCNPEPGGLYYRDLVETLDFLKDCQITGMDLTELAPAYDHYSPIIAAKLVFKALSRARI